MSIRISISFSISSKESLKNLKDVNLPIQLGLFKMEVYEELGKDILKTVIKNGITVNVVHLPINCLSYDHIKIIDIIKLLSKELACEKFVIHPNYGIEEFTELFLKKRDEVTTDFDLCIENFQWRRKKYLRSPLEIHRFCEDHFPLRMTFDTSHAEEVWFDYKIFSFLMDKIDVIHLSNRTGKKQHKPFNCNDGDLNLVGFVKDLVKRYKWYGHIVLEYMYEYNSKLYPNYFFLERLIGGE